jgi:hypothetical protein
MCAANDATTSETRASCTVAEWIHVDMTESKSHVSLPVPTPTEVAASLPPEAVQYDPTNPPLPGSVQRES